MRRAVPGCVPWPLGTCRMRLLMLQLAQILRSVGCGEEIAAPFLENARLLSQAAREKQDAWLTPFVRLFVTIAQSISRHSSISCIDQTASSPLAPQVSPK